MVLLRLRAVMKGDMIGVFLLLVGVTDLAAAVAPESTLTSEDKSTTDSASVTALSPSITFAARQPHDYYDLSPPSPDAWAHLHYNKVPKYPQNCRDLIYEDVPQEYYNFNNATSLRDSDYTNWYANMTILGAVQSAYKEQGEGTWFGKMFTDSPERVCDWTTNGCSPNTLRFHETYRLWCGDADLARKIFFTDNAIQQEFRGYQDLGASYVQAQVDITLRVGDIVKSFTQQAVEKADTRCKNLHALVQMGIEVTVGILFAVATAGTSMAVTPEVFSEWSEVAKILETIERYSPTPKEDQDRALEDLRKILSTLKGAAFNVAQTAGIMNTAILINAGKSGNPSMIYDDDGIDMQSSYVSGMCASFDGGFDAENPKHMDALSDHIVKVFQFLRARFENFGSLLFNGIGSNMTHPNITIGSELLENQPSALAFMLAKPLADGGPLETVAAAPERATSMIRSAVLKGLVTWTLAWQQCFVKCQVMSEGHESALSINKTHKQAFLWPYPNDVLGGEATVCVLRMLDHSTKEMYKDVPGVTQDNLQRFNWTLEEFYNDVTNSYLDGQHVQHPVPVQVNNGQFQLPVAFPSQAIKRWRDRPCSSGGLLADGAGDFWNQTHWNDGRHKGDKRYGTLENLLKECYDHDLPEMYNKVPATRFVAECSLGVMYKHHDRANPHCKDAVAALANATVITQNNSAVANCYFCGFHGYCHACLFGRNIEDERKDKKNRYSTLCSDKGKGNMGDRCQKAMQIDGDVNACKPAKSRDDEQRLLPICKLSNRQNHEKELGFVGSWVQLGEEGLWGRFGYTGT